MRLIAIMQIQKKARLQALSLGLRHWESFLLIKWFKSNNDNEQIVVGINDFGPDQSTREEFIDVLRYYRDNTTKADDEIESLLPQMIEYETPIPEELCLNYEIAKHDIK